MKDIELKIRQDMREAAAEDRERFFVVADTLSLQPKYKEFVTSGVLESIKQQWRDMTNLLDYPNIDFPISLPSWFPKVNFASGWEKDTFINSSVSILEQEQERRLKYEQEELVKEALISSY